MTVFQKIWIRKNLVIGTFLLGCVFSAFLVSMIPPTYPATAIINFISVSQNINEIHTAEDIKPLSSILKEEELKARSPEMLLALINKLDLSQKPEINPETDPHKSKLFMLQKYIAAYQNVPMPDYTNTEYIKAYLNENLDIQIKNGTEIHLTFKSVSPYLSRAIANTLADLYLKEKSPHGDKKLIAKTTELPTFTFTPYLYSAIYSSILFSLLISLILGITTPLPKQENI